MLKDLFDHDRIFDARDHFHRIAAVLAGLDIDVEHPLGQFMIGGNNLALEQVHLGTLRPLIEMRQAAGVKHKSINLALSVVRRILNLAARLWRDEPGNTWLETAPLIQLLPTTDVRNPYPISWEEQATLMQALPDHLARMCFFKVNTGCREQEVCRLRWEREIAVPELGTSVFIILGAPIKNREDRLIVLNEVAKSAVDARRGTHATHVFSYQDHPLTGICNSAWKRARGSVDLSQVRLHDLKHAFGRRLRAAGVPLETRKVLLGHRNGDITSHYSAAEIAELLEAANRVCSGKSGKTSAGLLLRQKSGDHSGGNRLIAEG